MYLLCRIQLPRHTAVKMVVTNAGSVDNMLPAKLRFYVRHGRIKD